MIKLFNILTFKKSLFLFFTNGSVIEVNHLNGKLISTKNLKMKNILKVILHNTYFLIYQKMEIQQFSHYELFVNRKAKCRQIIDI